MWQFWLRVKNATYTYTTLRRHAVPLRNNLFLGTPCKGSLVQDQQKGGENSLSLSFSFSFSFSLSFSFSFPFSLFLFLSLSLSFSFSFSFSPSLSPLAGARSPEMQSTNFWAKCPWQHYLLKLLLQENSYAGPVPNTIW